MVKRIIDILILLPFALWLAMYDWPDDPPGIISTVALIVFSAAAGISIYKMIGGRKHGKTKN